MAEPSAGPSKRLCLPDRWDGIADSGKEAGPKRSAIPFVAGGEGVVRLGLIFRIRNAFG
ncbi:MAG: hypothetical protein WBE85_01135 [Methylocella sp.]